MKLISKSLLIEHESKHPPVAGFITYISNSKPVLMHCYGWEDYSDGYDDYSWSISEDNGQTWSQPKLHWKGYPVPEGKIRYGEPSAFFDSDRRKLVVVTDKILCPNDQLDIDQTYSLAMDIYDADQRVWTQRTLLDFFPELSPFVSFGFPIKASQGSILFPAMRQVRDSAGKVLHHKDCWAPVNEPVIIIGQYDSLSHLHWRLSRPVPVNPDLSSRGLEEPALLELGNGQIIAVCRGDNSMFTDKPGYKWLSFSSDQGETWSVPTPLLATDGTHLESGANGSAFFRSIANGKLYWIGNPCLSGQKAKGNWPRLALVAAEVQEEPFAIKKDTFFVIDEKNYNDSADIQFSNFRFYQDRKTGNLILYMVRYCQQGLQEWWRTDYYKYEVKIH